MRILLACLQSLRPHTLPAYSFWRNYFLEGLAEAGHHVVEVPGVDWAEGLTYSQKSEIASWRSRTWEAVLSFVRRELQQRPIHIFIGYLYPQQVEVDAVAGMQRLGIPCVNYFCDNVREFTCVPAEYRPFALHWVPEFEALGMYRKAGLPHVHLPMPCWIATELRSVPGRETEPALFLGSADILRRDLFGQAMQGGADFCVRGAGWLANDVSRNDSLRRQSIGDGEICRKAGCSKWARPV